jgi:hypothetical protein
MDDLIIRALAIDNNAQINIYTLSKNGDLERKVLGPNTASVKYNLSFYLDEEKYSLIRLKNGENLPFETGSIFWTKIKAYSQMDTSSSKASDVSVSDNGSSEGKTDLKKSKPRGRPKKSVGGTSSKTTADSLKRRKTKKFGWSKKKKKKKTIY